MIITELACWRDDDGDAAASGARDEHAANRVTESLRTVPPLTARVNTLQSCGGGGGGGGVCACDRVVSAAMMLRDTDEWGRDADADAHPLSSAPCRHAGVGGGGGVAAWAR